MRISMPQKNKHYNESIIYHGELRNLSKIKDDYWQLKISIPEITIYDNFWAKLTEEEIDFILGAICRYRELSVDEHKERTPDES